MKHILSSTLENLIFLAT